MKRQQPPRVPLMSPKHTIIRMYTKLHHLMTSVAAPITAPRNGRRHAASVTRALAEDGLPWAADDRDRVSLRLSRGLSLMTMPLFVRLL